MTFAFILQSSALGPIIQILPFLLIFAVFYFLIIMPQRKRQQQLQATIASLKAGDKIITTGGIIAKIAEVRDTSLLVRTADKSILEISRAAVAGMHGEEEKKS
ncbi:MAG TPA: preprotein translocase subunit YajC [Pyrinomonadaceae bacterium]|jgi:preprotein translocase subunit YajC|nr:preprotein translocase subunit YajC [Pyrinomonadaceae bacterium]